jgi:Tfp pilus assembly PilM family ATPase
MFGAGKKTSVGIDIGSRSIRLVKLTASKGKPVLSTLGSISMPKGAVSGGEIVDIQTVAESIQSLMKKVGLKDKNVVLGVGNQRVIVRLVEMAYMEPKELASAIKFQAQDFIPIPVEDAIIDYEIIDDYINEEGERLLQIILVAAHRGMVSLFIEAAEKAGLKPEIIDINAFAVARSLLRSTELIKPEEATYLIERGDSEVDTKISADEYPLSNDAEESLPTQENINSQNYDEQVDNNILSEEADRSFEIDGSVFTDEDEGPPRITDGYGEPNYQEQEKEVIALIDIGADITNVCVVEDDAVKFVRVIGIGGDDWTDAVVEIMGVSFDEAEDLKVRIGLPPLSGDRYLEVPGEYLDKADTVFNILEKEIIRFISEIRRSFEYYISQSGGNRITKVFFCGGSSSLKNLSSYLEKGLDVVVGRVSPFGGVYIPPRLREQLAHEDEASYTIALGLALRGLEG